MTGTEGQDWANYQVAQPSTSGLGFVFVKATEGTSYVNPKHDAQVAHGRSAGLVTGHYHFQRPGSPTAQASYFLTHAKPKAGDVLACDWEDPGVSGADKDAFIRALQHAKPGLRTVLYCNRDFWLHRDTTSFAGDGLWIADPSAPKGHPRVSADWVFHQYGSPGGLDRNYTPMTAAQLRAWAAGTTTHPQEDTMPTPKDLWAYKNTQAGDKHDMHAALVSVEAQARTNGSSLTALAAKVDKLAVAPAPTIDYAKLAAALLTAIKNGS